MVNPLKSIRDSGRKRIAFAIIASAVIIAGGFTFSWYYYNHNSGSTKSVQLSNISANISISPESFTPASGSHGSNLTGALIEIWPVYHTTPSVSAPSYMDSYNISPMITAWINTSWKMSLKMPMSFIKAMDAWKPYFVNAEGGETSLIVKISYVSLYNSTFDSIYTYTVNAPYNPFRLNTSDQINISAHPYVSYSESFLMPSNNMSYSDSPVYAAESLYSADSSPYNPDSPPPIPPQWIWYNIDTTYFFNSQIPLSFLNETSTGVNSMGDDSIYIGSTSYNTQFSMASGYDYSGTESHSMGTSAEYTSGLYTGSNDILTEYGQTNLTNHDGVVTILGNATIWRYQYDYVQLTEFGLAILQKSTNFQTDMAITSLNHSNGEFHLSSFWAGHINLNKYNSAEYKTLNIHKRYQYAFGIYFNGTDSSALWGNKNSISSISTVNVGSSVHWSQIYTSIGATKSNVYGEVDAYLSIAVALAGVALATGWEPFGDATAGVALFGALVGFSTSVASLFLNGVLSVSSGTLLYGGFVKNQGAFGGGGSQFSLENWYTPADINVNGESYQIPTNYAIITP